MRLRQGTPLGIAAVASVLSGAVCTTFSGLEAEKDAGTTHLEAGVDAADAGEETGQETGEDASPTAPSYLSLEEAAKACSMVFDCPNLASSIVWSMGVPVDDLNYSLCLHWLAGPVPKNRIGFGLQADVFQCIAEATTCGAAGACLWVELISPGDERCADAGAAELCADDGGTVLRCAYQYVVHCDSAYYAAGSTCMEGINGWKGCGLGQDCSTVTSCVGPVLTYCALDTLEYELNCSYAGYTCGFEEDSGYPCVPEEGFKACTIPGASRCADDTAWICDGLFESAFDCSSLGYECTDDQGAARCVPPTASCAASDSDQNACSGSSIDVCVGGEPETIDCESIGLTCVPASQGKSAHCG